MIQVRLDHVFEVHLVGPRIGLNANFAGRGETLVAKKNLVETLQDGLLRITVRHPSRVVCILPRSVGSACGSVTANKASFQVVVLNLRRTFGFCLLGWRPLDGHHGLALVRIGCTVGISCSPVIADKVIRIGSSVLCDMHKKRTSVSQVSSATDTTTVKTYHTRSKPSSHPLLPSL
jgi:hypothetical protein